MTVLKSVAKTLNGSRYSYPQQSRLQCMFTNI